MNSTARLNLCRQRLAEREAALRPARAIARAGFTPTSAKRRFTGGAPAVHYALVNGTPAILFVLGDQVVGAVTFDITGGKIATVRGIAAPSRLIRLGRAWRQHEPDTPLIAQW